MSESLSAQDLVAVAEHVYVTSPARSLLDATKGLTRVETLRLIDEFCGTYAVDPANPKGFVTVPPLTDAREIRRLCERLPNSCRARRLKSDLAFALDGGASPAEAAMSTLLCVPFKNGGYSFPLPKMNEKIVPSAYAAPLVDRNHYVGDAVWKKQRLVLEYDSRAEHSHGTSVAHDNIRKMALESMGYHVVSITNVMLADQKLFERVAVDAARRLGHRIDLNRRGDHWQELHAQARAVLLDAPAAWWRAYRDAARDTEGILSPTLDEISD